jgi:hypothetical protein
MTARDSRLSIEEAKRPASPALAAIAFVGLFLAGLAPVTILGGRPWFPGPAASIVEVQNFFMSRNGGALICAFCHFGAAMALGVFTVQVCSQLRFRKTTEYAVDLTLLSGLITATVMVIASCVLWTATYVEVSQNASLLFAVFKLQFGLGGPGFSVPFGLFIGAITLAVARTGNMPRWLVIAGFVIFLVGEVSWIEILTVKAIPLIPVTRFFGFLWILIGPARLRAGQSN